MRCSIPAFAQQFRSLPHVATFLQVWNPSFDVTPAELIEGIITEKGLVPKLPSGGFDVPALVKCHTQLNGSVQEAANGHGSNIPGFYALDLETVKDYLAEKSDLCKLLGPPDSKSDWQVNAASNSMKSNWSHSNHMNGSQVVHSNEAS